jgi:thiamine kinase
MDPAESLARILGVTPSRVELLSLLEGGYGNHSYRLRCGDDEFVLRVPARPGDLPGVDREAEQLALSAVGAHGLGPEVVFSDPGSGMLVTKFLPGRRWTHADFSNIESLAGLGQTLAALHSIDPPPQMRRLDLAAHVAALEARVQRVPERVQRGARKMLDRFDARPTRLCHNDVHAGNVIEDGDIRLLDWEYAAVGDPLFDLAGPICCERIDATDRAGLLSGYRTDGGSVDLVRLAAATWLYDYVMCLWELATATSNPTIEPPVAAMRQPLSSRIDELERGLDSLNKPLIDLHF